MEDSVSWVGTEEQVEEEDRSWVVVQAWEDRSWGWASLCTPVWSVVEEEEEAPCKSVSWVGPSRRSHLIWATGNWTTEETYYVPYPTNETIGITQFPV